MMISSTSEVDCRLDIAGLGVTLACNDAALLEGVRREYAGFLDPPDIHLVASIDYRQPPPGPARPEINPLFRQGRVHFDNPGFQGEIDLLAGRASLTLVSADPFADLDYFLRVIYALLLFRAGGLLFHGAGILRREKVYLFFGHSGSGKSTVARLSPEDEVLNDDLVGLRPAAGSWLVYPTPFGPPGLRAADNIPPQPLVVLLRLVQDQQVYLEAMRPGQALAEVVSNIPVLPADPQMGGAVLARGQALLSGTPAYRLHFQPDPSFWEVIDALPL